jgi:hypothetical protein
VFYAQNKRKTLSWKPSLIFLWLEIVFRWPTFLMANKQESFKSDFSETSFRETNTALEEIWHWNKGLGSGIRQSNFRFGLMTCQFLKIQESRWRKKRLFIMITQILLILARSFKLKHKIRISFFFYFVNSWYYKN